MSDIITLEEPTESVITVGTDSTDVLEAQPFRQYLQLVNDSDEAIYVSFTGDAGLTYAKATDTLTAGALTTGTINTVSQVTAIRGDNASNIQIEFINDSTTGSSNLTHHYKQGGNIRMALRFLRANLEFGMVAGSSIGLKLGANNTDVLYINRTTTNVGIGASSPNANAILDVASTTKAFMPPRMTTTQRDAIASPTAGMVIYNSTDNVLNFYNGSAWGAV